MTTQSTTSGSFVECDILVPAPEPAPALCPRGRVPLKAPEDILKLLHKYVKWETAEDLHRAHWIYLAGGGEDANFDIGKELKVLKELCSVMKEQYDICMKQRDEEGIVAEGEDTIKYLELNSRLSSIGTILSRVKIFIRFLESAITRKKQQQEISAEYENYSGRCGTEEFIGQRETGTVKEVPQHAAYGTKEKKRKRHLDRVRVEEGLSSLLTNLGGQSYKFSPLEFRIKWDHVVNDLYDLVG